MKIVNPLYDHAFKYLMQNERIAKKVLSVLLECEILELKIEQQEIVSVDEFRGLKLFRLDFSAIIVNEFGEKQKVLIELQKSKLPTNLLRFRSYLGNSYTKKEVEKNDKGKTITKAYPIISIYILGYNVTDIPYLAVTVNNKITNTVTKQEIEINSDFINLLTHKTRIIQVQRLDLKRQTRLEQFLLLFNQSWVTTEKYILDLQEIPQEFSDIANYLESPLLDESFRNQLKGEEEIDDIFRDQEAELKETQQEREEERRLKEEERRLKEEAIKKQTATQYNVAKYLLEKNTPLLEISTLTGLSEEEILSL